MANVHLQRNVIGLSPVALYPDEHILEMKLERKTGLPLLALEEDFREGAIAREVSLNDAWDATIGMIAAAKLWTDGLHEICCSVSRER